MQAYRLRHAPRGRTAPSLQQPPSYPPFPMPRGDSAAAAKNHLFRVHPEVRLKPLHYWRVACLRAIGEQRRTSQHHCSHLFLVQSKGVHLCRNKNDACNDKCCIARQSDLEFQTLPCGSWSDFFITQGVPHRRHRRVQQLKPATRGDAAAICLPSPVRQ